MATSNSNGDSVGRGDAFSAEHGIIQDIFEKMAQMELERHEKAQRMIQLEKEKLELTLRNITLERTVHALKRGSEIRKQDAIDGGDIPSDGHETSDSKTEQSSASLMQAYLESQGQGESVVAENVGLPHVGSLIVESVNVGSTTMAKQIDPPGHDRELVSRFTYKTSDSESTFPCILLKSQHPNEMPISIYSKVLKGYDGFAFHVEKTVYGHSVLIAFPKSRLVRDLAREILLHPLIIHGRHYNGIETEPAVKLAFHPTIKEWINTRGARRKIIIRGIPIDEVKMRNAIVS